MPWDRKQLSDANGRRGNRIFPLAVLAVLCLSSFLFFKGSLLRPGKPPIAKPDPPKPRDKVLSGKITRGETLSGALRMLGLATDLCEGICSSLKTMIDLRRMNPGDTFEVRLSPEDRFLGFSFQTSPIDIYEVRVNPQGEWATGKKEVPVEKVWARVRGEIASSLFETMDKLGEEDQLVLDFADIFSCQMDFSSEVQPGDRFQIVVEKYYTGETFVKYGRILFAEYDGSSKKFQGIYFLPQGGKQGDYYTRQGAPLRRGFLRSPLKFTRISSGYTKSRRHPILGGLRPHYGIDYAAPPGTPVLATADGIVTSCGWNGGFGNQVILQHARGYRSMYGHLSRFAPGLRRGARVRQKQVIGYVGSTGLSTGPHLDFRLSRRNVYCNPLREIPPPAPPLPKAKMPEFQSATEEILHWVGDPALPKVRRESSFTSGDLK